METITSAANSKIKQLKKLDKASERKELGLLLVEGLREVVLAYRAGYEVNEIFVCEEYLKEQNEYKLSEVRCSKPIVNISKSVYESIAYRDSTEGVVATVKIRNLSLKELTLTEHPLVLVIEGVEKPGNLGAMLRTADAAGVDAVIVCDAKCDVFNPNVIRSSIGTLFTNAVAVCNTTEAIGFLKEKKIRTFAAELSARDFHYEKNYQAATAFVVGTEATGLTEEWINAADEKIKIPMRGEIDSMNVSVSAGILLFEAVRQRSSNTRK